MKPSNHGAVEKNSTLSQAILLCAAISSLLLITSSASAQPIDSATYSALTRSILLQTQIPIVTAENSDFGELDPALIDTLVQQADALNLAGDYENAIQSLENALQVSRSRNGLYHDSQIEIIDALIANEVLRENWTAVNDLYDLEEYLLRRLYEPTDARLEIGLEKITAWHIRAVNEDISLNKLQHYEKAQELLAIRLNVVENLLGNDNARYEFIFNNLVYAELQLEKHRVRRSSGGGSPVPAYTPMSIE